jgi:hypothetical protein
MIFEFFAQGGLGGTENDQEILIVFKMIVFRVEDGPAEGGCDVGARAEPFGVVQDRHGRGTSGG